MLNGLTVPGLHNLITRVPPVTPAPAPYAAVYTLNWLSSAGTACFLAAIAAALLPARQPAAVRRRLQGDVRPAREIDADDCLDAGPGVSDELLGHDVDAGHRARGDGQHVSVLQRHPRMARRVPDRERHVGQCACSAICR